MQKIYVIQFRTDVSEEHEQKSFQEELDLPEEQLVFVSAVKGTMPLTLPDDAAGVVMGGSGEFYISEGHGRGDWLDQVYTLLEEILEKNVPFLGLCYGFQLFGDYFGAAIVDDEEMRETGSHKVTLLEGAKDDLLFKDMPETFYAQFGHKDTVVNIPDVFIPLCKSERVACEGVRLKGKDAWGVLFHAELTKNGVKERIEIFPNYTKDPGHMEKTIGELKDSTEATDLLRRFVSYALQRVDNND